MLPGEQQQQQQQHACLYLNGFCLLFPEKKIAQRTRTNNRPVWRDELTELTGYKLEEVVECGEELWNFYEKMFPSHRVSEARARVEESRRVFVFG